MTPNRRDFTLGAAALATLGTLAVSGAARAQAKRTFRVANPNNVLDAQQAFVTCGLHPRLGYYAAENVGIEYVNMSSIVQAMASVATGQTDMASLAPALYLPAIAKEPQLGLIACYEWLPRQANVVVVRPESPIKSIADTVGKKIGIRNQGDGGIAQLTLMYSELGLPTADINFIAVGEAGVAGTAMANGTVDCYVTFDAQAGRIEAVGFPLRYLPLPPAYGKLGSGWFGMRKKDLKEDRKNAVGFCRAVAKSTLFAYTNFDRAVDLHWALYPDSKPRTKAEEESRREIEVINRQRRQNWIRRADDPDQRWGASSDQEWKTLVQIAAKATNNPQLPQQIGDLSNVYTNELIDEINAFDKQAVIRQAREFRM
jgi:NitT/TauT family transport system substrate-binding protein